MNSEGDGIIVDQRDPIQVITIDRPKQRNALTRDASLRIAAALDTLDASDDLHAAVLTGAGGTFCAGMDLKRFLAGEDANVPGRGFGGLTLSPPRKPLIAAVEGHALGGGFELVLACDLVVAARNSVFGLPEVRRGLVARAGGLMRLPAKIPRNIAAEVALTGTPITAHRAEALGLANRLVDDGEALDAALDLASQIADNAPLALAACKRVLGESMWLDEAAWDRQNAVAAAVFQSADAQEGARAFAERRPPQWAAR